MVEGSIVEIFERVAELRDAAEKKGYTELAHFLEAAANVAQDMVFQGHVAAPEMMRLLH